MAIRKKGKSQNAVTINGLNMLKLQADKAWEMLLKLTVVIG